MIVILAKEKEDMKKGRSRSISMVTTQGCRGQKRKYPYNTASNEKKYVKKKNTSAKGNGINVPCISNASENEGFKGKCNYCHKFGHKKTDCRKLKAVQDKKGNHWVNVCFESNVIDVSSDTWWLDSGVTIHACNYVQVMVSKMSPTSHEQYVFMGDNIRVQVSFLGVVRLHLRTEKKK